jgi:hypothetical protein
MRTAIMGMCLSLVLVGCKENRLTQEQVEQAGNEAVGLAIQHYQAGELLESHWAMERAFTLLADYDAQARQEEAGGPGRRSMDMPSLDGLPGAPGSWSRAKAAEWKQRYAQSVEGSWSVIRTAVREETARRGTVAAIVGYLDPRYQQKLKQEVQEAKPILHQRRRQQYYLECEGDQEVCALVLGALRNRMGRQTVTGAWTGNRSDYQGTIQARVEVLKHLVLKKGGTGQGSFPKKVQVQFTVETHNGAGPWDGSHTVTAEVDHPGQVGAAGYMKARVASFQEMQGRLQEALAQWKS